MISFAKIMRMFYMIYIITMLLHLYFLYYTVYNIAMLLYLHLVFDKIKSLKKSKKEVFDLKQVFQSQLKLGSQRQVRDTNSVLQLFFISKFLINLFIIYLCVCVCYFFKLFSQVFSWISFFSRKLILSYLITYYFASIVTNPLKRRYRITRKLQYAIDSFDQLLCRTIYFVDFTRREKCEGRDYLNLIVAS